MTDITDTLAKIAAASMLKTAAPADQQQAPAEQQAMEQQPMEAQPDVVEQDNMRLQNLLSNLQLRADVVKAQRSLERLQQPKRRAARPAGDPDMPQPEGRAIAQEDMTGAALTSMMQSTPKIKRDLAPREKKETKQRRKETSKGVDNTADDKADRDRSLTEPVSEPSNES